MFLLLNTDCHFTGMVHLYLTDTQLDEYLLSYLYQIVQIVLHHKTKACRLDKYLYYVSGDSSVVLLCDVLFIF